LIDGVTLRHLLRRGLPPLKKVLQIGSQLADALAKGARRWRRALSIPATITPRSRTSNSRFVTT
jgi:hypothetical protein